MDKLAASITKAGTFLFRAPADDEPITKKQIRENMVAWIFDPRDAHEYVTLLGVERFTLTRDESTNYIYADDDNQPEEITQEDAKKLYSLMKTHIEEKTRPIQKVNK